MHITFTHTEYHAEPESEAIWILTADVSLDLVWVMADNGNEYSYRVANIQTALTHEGPVKISDIDPRLLAEMEQAAIAWVNDGRESLPEMGIASGLHFFAWVNGHPIAIAPTYLEAFSALLQHINTPQTQS